MQWRGKPVWGYKLVSILANTLLDIQILIGVILVFFGIKPPVSHLLLVAIAAVLSHYSYSVEKRHGGSFATVAVACGAIIPVMILFM